jgi:hypothetical protein
MRATSSVGHTGHQGLGDERMAQGVEHHPLREPCGLHNRSQAGCPALPARCYPGGAIVTQQEMCARQLVLCQPGEQGHGGGGQGDAARSRLCRSAAGCRYAHQTGSGPWGRHLYPAAGESGSPHQNPHRAGFFVPVESVGNFHPTTNKSHGNLPPGICRKITAHFDEHCNSACYTSLSALPRS